MLYTRATRLPNSVAAYRRPFPNVPIREDFPKYDTPIFPYGYEKARMEAYIQTRMDEGLPITVIRPSLTYGIGCNNIGVMRNNYGIIDRMRKGKRIVQFGEGTNPWAWTFAPDLALAYAYSLGREHVWDNSIMLPAMTITFGTICI